MGTDVLRLHDPKGTLVVEFNNANPGPAHPAAHGAVYYKDAQRVYNDTGAYAGAAERGSIESVTNPARTAIASLRLQTQTT